VRSWKDLEREWEPIVERLRKEGFDVQHFTIAMPVQIIGVLPGGEPFYFRERYGHAYLGVGGDAVWSPHWEATEDVWDGP
jgi:hypothetical protein